MISIHTYHKYIYTYEKYGFTAVYFSHYYPQLGQSFRSKHADHTTAFEPGMVEASILASTRIEKGLPRLEARVEASNFFRGMVKGRGNIQSDH